MGKGTLRFKSLSGRHTGQIDWWRAPCATLCWDRSASPFCFCLCLRRPSRPFVGDPSLTPQQEPSTTTGLAVIIGVILGLALIRKPRRKRKSSFQVLYVLAGLAAIGMVAVLIRDTVGQILLAGTAGLLVWYRWFYLPRRRRFHVKTLGELLALTPRQFEEAAGEVLRDNGYRSVKHVGGSGDLSADLMCRDDRGRLIAVQCKRYSPGIRIGSRDIQEFIGMMAVHHQADRGVFITTTEFTQPAIDLARKHGITLVDGQELTRMIEKGNRTKGSG